MMDEKAMMRIVGKVMMDKRRQQVFIPIIDAYLLIGAIQLASRHPAVGKALRERHDFVSMTFEKAIRNRHPGVEVTVTADTDENAFVENAASAMSDETPLPVPITVADAWLIVCALQVAARHPETPSDFKKQITQIARQFEKSLIRLHPKVEPIIVMGWDERYDY